MPALEKMTKTELKELLSKNWMTHDAMWFFNACNELGIDTANKLNKNAIKMLAPFEVGRMMEMMGVEKEKQFRSFEELKEFFIQAFDMILPKFMNVKFSFPEDNVIQWEWVKCFAFDGTSRMGVVDRYECGVMYRIQCWLDTLKISYDLQPPIKGCLMHSEGTCSGALIFNF